MSVRKRYQSARRNNRRQRPPKTEANSFITKPASSSDSDYKLLFSCPEVVRDMLTGYAQGKWLNDADFSTLVHVNGSYVSESGRQRHDDVVWRMKIGERWLWVYIILEFQSESDPWMALRMTEYVTQLALQITREHKKYDLPEGRIPPILPIVLYNGSPEWNAATDVADCFIEPPEGLEAFLPKLRYLLLDEQRLQQSPTEEIRNFADAVFRMEANRSTDKVFAVIEALAEMLNAPEQESLQRVFNAWAIGLVERNAPGIGLSKKITNIFKERKMAEAIYMNWGDQREKKGETKILIRQLSRRFGQLPKWAENRISEAKSEQLETWADAVLDASNLTEVLGTPD
jgi:hypothetical protein